MLLQYLFRPGFCVQAKGIQNIPGNPGNPGNPGSLQDITASSEEAVNLSSPFQQ